MTTFLQFFVVLVCSCATIVVAQYGTQVSNSAIKHALVAPLQFKVDTGALQSAITALKRGSISLEDANLMVEFPKKTFTAAETLWNGYSRAVEDPGVAPEAEELVRELFLLLMDQGLNVSVSYEDGRHRQSGNLAGTPLGYLLRELNDPKFIDAFLDGGHDTHGTIVHMPSDGQWGSDTDPVLGISYIHFVANSGLEVHVIRSFYRLYSNYQRQIKAAAAGGPPADFDACLRQTNIGRLVDYSKSANATVQRIRLGATLFGQNMSLSWASDIDREMHYYVLRRMFEVSPKFEWVELITDVPSLPTNGVYSHSNPVLLATVLGKSGVIEAITDEIHNLDHNRDFAREMLKIALAAKLNYKGRCALHIAAVRKGKNSKLWKAIEAAELEASGNLDRLAEIRDEFGRTPNDYDGTTTTVTRYSFAHENQLLSGDGKVEVELSDDASVQLYSSPPDDNDNGGWGNEGTNSVSIPSRCDLQEVFGMPSRDQLISIIERNVPTIFRGAVRNWTFREAWQKDKFVAKYGETTVRTAEIPYADTFDDKAPSNTMTMNEYINAWGTPDNESPSGAPMYMFTADYTNENPPLRDDIRELIELLHDVPDTNETDTLKELSPQFFVGPAASGAPMHWHNTALNALAFGEKHWYVLPPQDTFYSVLPSAIFAQDEVPQLESTIGVRQCTQRAGDLIFVGESYGHATLNTKPTIGFAMEFCLRDTDITVNVPPMEADLVRRANKVLSQRQDRRRTSRLPSGTAHQPYMAARNFRRKK